MTNLQRVSGDIVAEDGVKTGGPLVIRTLQSGTLRDAEACRGRRQHDRAGFRPRAGSQTEEQTEHSVVQARRRVRNAE